MIADPALQRIHRQADVRHRERAIVIRLLAALDQDDWATVHRCDRALGRLARSAA